MARRAALGIIGCGNISEAYLRLASSSPIVEIVAVADIAPAAAKARAEQFSVRAMGVDELLKNDEIDVVINLTIPEVHYQISRVDPHRPASTPIPRSRWR